MNYVYRLEDDYQEIAGYFATYEKALESALNEVKNDKYLEYVSHKEIDFKVRRGFDPEKLGDKIYKETEVDIDERHLSDKIVNINYIDIIAQYKKEYTTNYGATLRYKKYFIIKFPLN